MEAIGDLLQLFLPGCAQVRRILQARVPIIKYHQQFTDVECDLSMSNMLVVMILVDKICASEFFAGQEFICRIFYILWDL